MSNNEENKKRSGESSFPIRKAVASLAFFLIASANAAPPLAGNFIPVSTQNLAPVAVAVGGATPWIVSSGNSEVYEHTGPLLSGAWVAHPGPTPTADLAVSPDGVAWRIDTSGQISFLSGTSWTPFPGPMMPAGGTCARNIAVGSNAQVWVIGCGGSPGQGPVYEWLPLTKNWNLVQGTAATIAVSPEGTPWITDSSNIVYRWSGSAFQQVNGSKGASIGVGANQSAWVIAASPAGPSSYFPARFNGIQFLQASQVTGYRIAVGCDGVPWMLTAGLTAPGQLYVWHSNWRWLGPSGLTFGSANPAQWSGDVEDIDASTDTKQVIAATAGGGLWSLNVAQKLWTPISDTGPNPGPAQAVASLCRKPGDPTTLVIATGLAFSGNDSAAELGNGIWQGKFNGASWNWTQLSCLNSAGTVSPCPTSFAKIRYPSASTIFAGGPAGFLVSQKQGPFKPSVLNPGSGPPTTSFVVTDFAFASGGQTVYAAIQGVGIAISSDSGATFTKITSPFTSTAANGKYFQYSRIALAPSNNTLWITINAGTNDFNGVFVSQNITSANPAWTETALQGCAEFDGCTNRGLDNFMRSQNGHDGAIAVNPQNPNIVIAGGANNWITTNGGGTAAKASCSVNSCPISSAWHQIASSSNPVHQDIHEIVFNQGGQNVYLGTDGGIFQSTDGGNTWTDSINTIGVMNERAVSVFGDLIMGAAWDVGPHWSLNLGGNWSELSGFDNDSPGVFIAGPNEWYAHKFDPPDDIYDSTNQGASFSLVLKAIPPPGPFVQLGSQVFNVGVNVWELNNGSGSGAQYQPALPAFFQKNAPSTLTAFSYQNRNYVVAGGPLGGGSATANLIISATNGPWNEIGGALPNGSSGSPGIIKVKRDSAFSSASTGPVIYVLTSDGRVFADSAQDLANLRPKWIEITGNLPSPTSEASRSVNPSLAYSDITVDPSTGRVVVGSNIGAFATTNSCVSTVILTGLGCWPTIWQVWNDGLPFAPPDVPSAGTPGTLGSALNTFDSQIRIDGHLYIYAAIWERGIWIRDAGVENPQQPDLVFVSSFFDQQHFTSRDSSGLIWDAFYSQFDQQWHHQQIQTNNNPAASNVFVSVFQNASQQHFVYQDSSRNIWDAFYARDDNSWHYQQINTNGRTPAGAVFVSAFYDQQHFAFRDAKGLIWDSFFEQADNSWHFQQINTSTNPAATDVFISVFDQAAQQHFVYLDSSNNIWDSFYARNDNSWHYQQINTNGQKPAGAVFVSAFYDQQHFAFRDSNGLIWDSFFEQADNSWHFQQINTSTNPAATNVFISVFDQAAQQHFVYLDSSNNIWDSFYARNDNSWHYQQINTNGHSPTGWTFVSAFYDQQHFVFRDSKGLIWDSFYAQTGNSWHFQMIYLQ